MSDTQPIEKTRKLNVSAEKAFRHFTENIHLWWPLKSHSLSGELAEKVVFEGKAGGRVYETDRDGRERDWGLVSTYEPFSRLVFSWVLEQPDRATEVEVLFVPAGEKACTLTLIHRGWDKRPDGAEWRANYNNGWEGVLDACQGVLDG